MRKLMYCPPDDDFLPDPSSDLLRDVTMNQGESYWLKGSQDGGMHFEDGDYTSELILWYRDALGFCVTFNSNQEEVPLVLTQDPDDDALVTIRQTGNIVKLPKSHFVPRDLAYAAVLEFGRTGRRLESAQWIEFSPEDPAL